MKAITIHQTWASLIVHGFKVYETRGWAHRYRGLVAIHAGRHWNEDSKVLTQHLMVKYPELQEIGDNLPLGAIIGVANLTAIYKADDLRVKLIPCEVALGNYADGRFAWRMETPELYTSPAFCSGNQGLWTWDGRGAGEQYFGRVR